MGDGNFNSWCESFYAQISAFCYDLQAQSVQSCAWLLRNIKSMIGNQDLLGLILFGCLLVVSPFGKEADQTKVATSLFILDDKFELNDSSGCLPKSA